MSEQCWRCEDAPDDIEHLDEDHHLSDVGDWLTCHHEDGGGGTIHYGNDYCPKCGTKLYD